MKKYLFFATALAALASCTSNDFVGEDTSSTTNQSEQAAIAFGSGVKTVTRADYYGADAAAKLNNKFIVGGFKGATSPATTTVFDNYQVEWAANTAGKTQSNTSDWEYVGIEFADPSTLVNDAGDNHAVQSIKYWDYSADQYDFIAYSTGTATPIVSGDLSSGKVKVVAINAVTASTAAYTLEGDDDDLAKCYIADMVTAYKATMSPAQPKFQDEIQFQFRSLAAKVRVALYETVPGYSVKDVKFYTNNETTLAAGASATNATLFTTGTTNKDNFYTGGTCTVKFPTIGSANISKTDYNKAHVDFAATTKQTTKEFAGLNYTTKEKREKTGTKFLGRSSAGASFAGAAADNYYQIAMPNEEGTVLELRVDYTLESIDGSGEEIKVHGATAFVPQIYAQWKPNYAYTYIFKITDGTNGWTSQTDTDPAGLYPITFDAVVLEAQEDTQSTITTVSSPSITTYQKGHNYKDDGPEYKVASDSIYIQVMKDGTTLASDLDSKGALYTVTGTNVATVTEAEVMDALNIRTSGEATTIVGRNGYTLTPLSTAQLSTGDATFGNIPGADGNPIPNIDANTAVRFPATAGTYAYVYYTGTDAADTDYHSAVNLTAEPTGWPTGYYTDEACTIAATTYADGTYYQKYTNLNKVYAVKVIRVQ